MKPDERAEETQVSHQETGTTSLVLGVAAVAMYGSPLLLFFLPPLIRYFPVYLTVPTGICAIVFGASVLYRMRGDERADRRRARAGIALGTVTLAVPVTLLVALELALQR
ncbi:hypothetical protein OG754_39810 (plasmid) [Streptomyces decoyicus]|uniref:hypothetical protein n=1 Tax=Streptomyces decoyicus TaxID=249567 RepID=UPI002E31D545|nr:hypothetical protein [Streptomyces decoyicus]